MTRYSSGVYKQIRLTQAWASMLLALGYISIYLQSPILLVLVMVFLFHSGHESIHNNIFPGHRRNYLYGTLAMAFMLHNYRIVRAAHLSHHACGRKKRASCLVDHRQDALSCSYVIYYFGYILGSAYIFTMLAGFLLLFSRTSFRRHYPFMRRGLGSAAIIQAVVVIHGGVVVYMFGYYAIVIYAVFMIYWSLSQNVAHYALPVGGASAKYAARTYEVGPVLNFLFFGSSFNHLSHHVLPSVPGPELRRPEIRQLVCEAIGAEPLVTAGIGRYGRDLLRQFSGPLPDVEPWMLYGPGHNR